MNEHRYDQNLDLHNNDYASEHHLSPDLAGDYNQDALNNPINSEQPREQTDQTDYTQPDSVAEDDYSSGYGEMEIQSNSYGSDLSDLNSSNDHIQFDSVSYEQFNLSLDNSSFEAGEPSRLENHQSSPMQNTLNGQYSATEQFHQPNSYLENQSLNNRHLQIQENQQNHLSENFDSTSHLRTGFKYGDIGYTPSYPSEITTNKEVTFKDSSGNEYEGTVRSVSFSGDKYDIQDSDGTTHHDVPYHNIEKYRSK